MKNLHLRLLCALICMMAVCRSDSFADSDPGTGLFRLIRAAGQTDEFSSLVHKASILKANTATIENLLREKPVTLRISIPVSGGEMFELDLVRTSPLSEDFRLHEKNGSLKRETVYDNEGIHYAGKLHNKQGSIATLSIFKDLVMGIISDERGNFVLGPVSDDGVNAEGEYVFYNDADLSMPFNFNCGVDNNEDLFYRNSGAKNFAGLETDDPLRLPIKVYFEADYQTYLDKGSNAQNVANYIAGFFNSVQAIYQAENIPVQISNIAVWTGADPYRNLNQSDTILFAFGFDNKDNFQGNLAHLVSTRSANLGGIAWIGVLCAQFEPSINAGRFAFSNIEGTYNNFPTYSWTVNVVTHEMGHNLGSRHTHSCTWPVLQGGALGAIDSCYFAEGNCFPQPRARVGTIMSYCHLWPANQGGGVNLSSGFGPLPGDTIRLRYTQAACLDREQNSSERPVTYDLAQNHPNPFNPSTVISFALPENSAVTLSVYDIAGRKIADLLSGVFYETGFHDVIFNAANYSLPSGIYFYRITAGNFSETKRMAVVK